MYLIIDVYEGKKEYWKIIELHRFYFLNCDSAALHTIE